MKKTQFSTLHNISNAIIVLQNTILANLCAKQRIRASNSGNTCSEYLLEVLASIAFLTFYTSQEDYQLIGEPPKPSAQRLTTNLEKRYH